MPRVSPARPYRHPVVQLQVERVPPPACGLLPRPRCSEHTPRRFGESADFRPDIYRDRQCYTLNYRYLGKEYALPVVRGREQHDERASQLINVDAKNKGPYLHRNISSCQNLLFSILEDHNAVFLP